MNLHDSRAFKQQKSFNGIPAELKIIREVPRGFSFDPFFSFSASTLGPNHKAECNFFCAFLSFSVSNNCSFDSSEGFSIKQHKSCGECFSCARSKCTKKLFKTRGCIERKMKFADFNVKNWARVAWECSDTQFQQFFPSSAPLLACFVWSVELFPSLVVGAFFFMLHGAWSEQETLNL